jgi:hypothetical protein
MYQDWLIYQTGMMFGISTELMQIKFLVTTEEVRILENTHSELISAHSYWTFALFQNQKKEFSSLSCQRVAFVEFVPAQFANGGDH